jgi:signal transduction histidine kinase
MPATIDSHLESLSRLERFLGSLDDLPSLLHAIIGEAARAVNAESSSLALYDESRNELSFHVAAGQGEEREFERKLKTFKLPMGKGVIGYCAERQELVNIPDAYQDSRFNPAVDRETGFVTRTILAVPMTRHDKLIGVVEAVNRRDHQAFTENDEKVLAFLATQAALVIENARLYQENLAQARLSALGQGIAGAAHCIKNILNGIDGGSFILESGLKRENLAGVGKGWTILKRNTGIMRGLVMDMLTYSRDRKPELSATDPNDVCREVADLMAEKAREQGVALEVQLQGDIGELQLDRKGIYRCVLNLVSNAIDACGKSGNGQVTLSSRLLDESATELEIAIADNGCGISAENLKNLFRAFFSTKGSKGTGLGLSVTRKIVQEHGGDVTVESTEGVGTTFRIILPFSPVSG